MFTLLRAGGRQALAVTQGPENSEAVDGNSDSQSPCKGAG